MAKGIEDYNFDEDAEWQAYVSNITIPDPSREKEIIHKFKGKYYKKNVDPGFDIDAYNASFASQTHSHSGGSCCGGEKSGTCDVKGGEDYILDTFQVGPLACNCSIIADKVTKQAALVDPGGDFEIIKNKINKLGVTVKLILITHAHFDHFLAAEEVRKFTGAKILLGEADLQLWTFLEIQCSLFGSKPPAHPIPPPDTLLKKDEKLRIGDEGSLYFNTIHTPGHSPGSTCYLFETAKTIFTGDTLFAGSVGRTDLLGGDKASLVLSIREKLYTLDESLTVIPGHNEHTTIGKEKKTNGVIRATM
eukprot:TRINITY_DN2847_c0_g2_i2.p1 TRINITY_DN2847_c0_g2~~TRINITY_DN2847_c0_g2_i2.p1  ORF type:complete len:305 (-),score=75.77 TRINITY_DN2847_c0_g2_i2:56-970(-)